MCKSSSIYLYDITCKFFALYLLLYFTKKKDILCSEREVATDTPSNLIPYIGLLEGLFDSLYSFYFVSISSYHLCSVKFMIQLMQLEF